MIRRSFLLFAAAFLTFQESALPCERRGAKSVRIEGTVEAVRQGRVEISAGRRSESLLLTDRTRVLQGGSEVDASALQAGDRVVAQGARVGSAQIEAREIRIAGQMDRTPTSSAPAAGGHKH